MFFRLFIFCALYSCKSHLERPSDISSSIFVAVLSLQDECEVWFDSILLFVPLLYSVHSNVYPCFWNHVYCH